MGYKLYIQTKGTFEGVQDRSVKPSASGQIVAPDGWNTDLNFSDSDTEELNMLEDKNWDYGKE